jgi:lysophospholipase L1-like esterase
MPAMVQKPPPERVIRIMPLGDSITQGAAGRDSYRRPLWRQLTAAGLCVDFVGSLRSNHLGPPLHGDFDQDHEGHWGWRADQVLARIDRWAERQRPHVVLIHLGTNDIGHRQAVGETVSELAAIIAVLRRHNPEVTVLLARIIPVAFPEARARIATFNAAVAELALETTTPCSPVVAVDHFTGFDAAADTYDGVHPNAAGERKMAERWAEALFRIWGRNTAGRPGCIQ